MVAWNQGIDLFAEADNRLALSFEYTASLLLGEKVHAYGKIVDTRGRINDIYEGILQHYRSQKRMDLPQTEKAAMRVRDHSRSVLSFFKGGPAGAMLKPAPEPSKIAATAGARETPTSAAPAGAIAVAPGESIQGALDKLKASGGGTVSLGSGLHTLPATLRLYSGVTIAGSGIDCELFLDPEKTQYEAAIVNADPGLHDVVLRDFVIEGATVPQAPRDPNSDVQKRRTLQGPIRSGIVFLADNKATLRNMRLEHVTVRNCIFSGVYINGAENLDVANCDFSANGGIPPPGPGKNHNLKLDHVSNVAISGSRLCDSMFGNGIAVSFGHNIAIRDCEIARNCLDGVRIAESRQVTVEASLAEGNGGSGIAQQTWMEPNQGVVVRGNTLRNNVNPG
jgi:polygalacturonase